MHAHAVLAWRIGTPVQMMYCCLIRWTEAKRSLLYIVLVCSYTLTAIELFAFALLRCVERMYRGTDVRIASHG